MNNHRQHDQPAMGTQMTNDVAVLLDLDNLVIGAKQANLTFDINLILDYIKKLTNGRIVLRRSYGDWRQSQKLLKELATAGFTTQSTVRLTAYSKNLADMQIVVDTMDTLIDGHQYSTYVLITGDRDFTPLVQSLRKRGKQVIGVGIKHTASRSFVSLCDHYIFYEDLIPKPKLTDAQVEYLLAQALDDLLEDGGRVRASVLRQRMSELSKGNFDQSPYAEESFSKFLARYPHLVEVEQVKTTVYVRRAAQQPVRELYLRYRTALKKQKLRVVAADKRFVILKDLIACLKEQSEVRWRELIDMLAEKYRSADKGISKNEINAVMLLARRAQVLRTLKGRSLSTAPVLLELKGDKLFQEAVIRCDASYVEEILASSEPFDVAEAALALYDTEKYTPYLQKVIKTLPRLEQ
ncbi:MAG TPA: NYN domain-containing protein [Anaerolineae bacterium]